MYKTGINQKRVKKKLKNKYVNLTYSHFNEAGSYQKKKKKKNLVCWKYNLSFSHSYYLYSVTLDFGKLNSEYNLDVESGKNESFLT
jgi:hypothetical protein